MGTDRYERFTRLSLQQRQALLARTAEDPALADQMRLSEAQRRMWFLERLTSGRALYNLPSAHRFRGELSVDALRSALGELTRLHEMLRMRYADVLGEPLQLPSGRPLDLRVIDLRGRDADAREAEVRRQAEQDAREPFVLLGGPLVRATVLQVADDDHVLLLNLHHSIGDGWSLGLLYDQLAQLYEDFTHGREPSVPAPKAGYLDHSARQRRWLGTPDAEQSLAFWRAELAGAPALLDLPKDAVEPGCMPGDGGVVSMDVQAASAESLRNLGRREGATLFMVMQSAYAMVLRRHCGDEDLVIGSSVSGRDHPDTADVVGLFANTAVFRVRVDASATFRQLLTSVRSTALNVYAHQDVPFDWLVDQLKVPRIPGRNPLFSAYLSVEGFSEHTVRLGGLIGEDVEAHGATSWFDVSLWVGERQDGSLRLDLTYAADRLAPTTARAMLDDLRDVLQAVVLDPEARRVDELAPVLERTEPELTDEAAPAGRQSVAEGKAPSTAMQRVVAETWGELLGRAEMSLTDDFFDLGGRSIVALQAVARLNEICGTDLHPVELFEAPTVEGFARLLSRTGARSSAGLRTIRPGSGQVIVCLPPVGGDILCYAGLVMALDTGRPVYAAAMPGLHDDAAPLRSVSELADHYLELLRTEGLIAPAAPPTLIGWSMGGLIAMEMACVLDAAAAARPEVVLIDSPPPGPADREPDLVEEFSGYLSAAVGRAETTTSRECPDHATLRAWARDLEIIGPEIDETRFRRLIELFRTNVRALDEDRIPPYGGPVLYLAAADDASERRWAPWQAALGPGLEVRAVPGNHFSMMARPHVAELAGRIGQWTDLSSGGGARDGRTW
ncbi:alpha/beta fold hydrolase [Streptomyces sp. SID5643]|uniref:alpha/beta fold hydrolase n=1 Tax=Streptomyces sp. SID5643 TaxID=2690307 RepID=UPI00136AA149|nr:alpha/beta fold hydrolase [Streptomyces sp. SID5643]MZF89103.1 alpha/beta fold hydrolase [Streptomyces sp. SID5643]